MLVLLLPLPPSLPLFLFVEKGLEEEEEAILAQSSDCSVQGIGKEKNIEEHFLPVFPSPMPCAEQA